MHADHHPIIVDNLLNAQLLGWEATHTVEDMCRSSWQFAKNASL